MPVKELVHIQASRTPAAGALWQACLRRYMLPGLEVADSNDNVFADLSALDFAGARLWSLRSNAQRVIRSRAVAEKRFLPVAVLQLRGRTRLSQYGKYADLDPGSFAFLNASAPLALDHLDDFEQLYLQFPSGAFTPGMFREAASMRMNANSVNDKPLFECTRNLWDAAPSLNPTEHSAALGALMSLCTLTSAFRHARQEFDVPLRVTRAMHYIEHHLCDETLNGQAVAEAQGVSRRHLDELFAKRGYRIESWIWERRLERAAMELSAADGLQKSILHIAVDLGFKSASHFSHAFARRFGMSPREYRQRRQIAVH